MGEWISAIWILLARLPQEATCRVGLRFRFLLPWQVLGRPPGKTLGRELTWYDLHDDAFLQAQCQRLATTTLKINADTWEVTATYPGVSAFVDDQPVWSETPIKERLRLERLPAWPDLFLVTRVDIVDPHGTSVSSTTIDYIRVERGAASFPVMASARYTTPGHSEPHFTFTLTSGTIAADAVAAGDPEDLKLDLTLAKEIWDLNSRMQIDPSALMP